MNLQNVYKKMLFFILVFTLLGIYQLPAQASSHTCKGVTCEGKNPSTMGCSATTSGTVKVLLDGVSIVETRKSVNGSLSTQCDAKWARTTNLTTVYRYLGASLRYGCANYCYAQSVSSPGKVTNVAPSNQVFTPMHAYAATSTRSCGATSTGSQILVPIGISSTSCTGVN
jgi:hypothetical protein